MGLNDARRNFPFQSKDAAYMWAEAMDFVPSWQYAPWPPKGTLLDSYAAALGAWLTACQGLNGLDTSEQEVAVNRAYRWLKQWDGGPVAENVAQEAAKTVRDALEAVARTVSNPAKVNLHDASINVWEVSARVTGSIVLSVETKAASNPNVVLALWRAAKSIRYDSDAGVSGDLGAWWEGEFDKVTDTRAKTALSTLANALKGALADLQASVTAVPYDPDAFAAALVGLANSAPPLTDALRGVPPSVSTPLETAMQQALNEAWKRATYCQQSVEGQLRGLPAMRAYLSIGSTGSLTQPGQTQVDQDTEWEELSEEAETQGV
jgi:hypothetical protein